MARRKKQNKRSASPPKPAALLSQCMIVKDEEKNIEKALSWAKGIAFEQIVVDTGSSDRTVEIAERMGAKVFTFKWVDDFSAAKNFAIEQAKGNWIAFLDADEYLTAKDAKHLIYILKRMQSDPRTYGKWAAINCPMAHMGDDGKPFAIQDQERFFRSHARYAGRIHEHLDVPAEHIAHIDEITIIHTGYAASALAETGKAERNIKMLREQLKDDPDDLNTKVYLADSLQAQDDPDDIEEAEMLFYESIRGNRGGFSPALKRKAYMRLISKYEKMPKKILGREDLCRKALLEFPGDIDFSYLLAEILNVKGDYLAAQEALQDCEKWMSDKDALSNSEIIAANPALLQKQLAIAEEGAKSGKP